MKTKIGEIQASGFRCQVSGVESKVRSSEFGVRSPFIERVHSFSLRSAFFVSPQEKLTLLLVAGRNIGCLLRSGTSAGVASPGIDSLTCRPGCGIAGCARGRTGIRFCSFSLHPLTPIHDLTVGWNATSGAWSGRHPGCRRFLARLRQRLVRIYHLPFEAFPTRPPLDSQPLVASPDIPKLLRDVLR